jgi:predicted transcriptional regulator
MLGFDMSSVEPSVFDDIDDAVEERAMEEAEAAYAAGRVISHEAMTKWLASWGTPGELPPPTVGS